MRSRGCVRIFIVAISLLLVSFRFSMRFSAVSVCGGVTGWMSAVFSEGVPLISGLNAFDAFGQHGVSKVVLLLELYGRRDWSAP